MSTLRDKHTDGPWKAVQSSSFSRLQYEIAADNGRKTLAETIGGMHKANALVMAAGPEMLAALYCILNTESIAMEAATQDMPAFRGLDVAFHFQAVRDAIKKADPEAANI